MGLSVGRGCVIFVCLTMGSGASKGSDYGAPASAVNQEETDKLRREVNSLKVQLAEAKDLIGSRASLKATPKPSSSTANLGDGANEKDKELAETRQKLDEANKTITELRSQLAINVKTIKDLRSENEGLNTKLKETESKVVEKASEQQSEIIEDPKKQFSFLHDLFNEEISGNQFMEELGKFPTKVKHEWILCMSAQMLRLGKLVSLTQAVSKSMHTYSQEVKLLTEQACNLLNAERATVWSIDDKTHELVSLASSNRDSEIRIPSNSGVAGHVFQTGEILNIEDAYDDYRFNQEVDQSLGLRTKAIIALPINGHSGYRMGVLQVMNKKTEDGSTTGEFDKDDEGKAEGLTIQVGIHLYLAQTYDEVLRIQKKVPLLEEIAGTFKNEIRVVSTMDNMVERIRQTVDSERASVFLADHDTQELWSKSASGTDEIRFPWTSGIAGLCFTSKETINIPDAYSDERFHQDIDKKTGFKTRNIVAMPFVDENGDPIGVLQAINKVDEEMVFTDEDEYYLKRLAFQASQNLMYAKLYEDVF